MSRFVKESFDNGLFECMECGGGWVFPSDAERCCPELKGEDQVTRPSHYNQGGVECIDAIESSMTREEFKGHLKANCMKYLWRYQHKGKPVEDLRKANWYLDRLRNIVADEV